MQSDSVSDERTYTLIRLPHDARLPTDKVGSTYRPANNSPKAIWCGLPFPRPITYTSHMNNHERLERYLALCKRMYERMRREGSWPWRDGADRGDEPES